MVFLYFTVNQTYTEQTFFHAFFSGTASTPRHAPKTPTTHFLSFDNSKAAEGTFFGKICSDGCF